MRSTSGLLPSSHLSNNPQAIITNDDFPLTPNNSWLGDVQNFSRSSDYRYEYPIVEIQGCSHKLTVTVWNEKALEVFNSVEVGCLVWLCEENNERPTYCWKGVEVTINRKDPEGDVRIRW